MTDAGSGLSRLGYRLWARLPFPVRQFAIRRGTPSFHVGAICVIDRADGALLLIRHSYKKRWGFPGGFLKRGETPSDAARREILEEVGVDVVIDDNPKVVVDPSLRRVDVIYTGRSTGEGEAKPRSPEILDARWFPADALPELQEEAVSALIELGRAHRPPVERG